MDIGRSGKLFKRSRNSISGPPLPPEPEGKSEFKLNPGERYGWWVENDREEERRQCTTVHGAVNNFRTQILLDTGATVTMISLDLARRLKIKLNSQKRIKVSGLGGVPSYITSSAQIKITLGWRVEYVMDVWVTNIGEGVDVLLAMDFMFSAGVRLGIRERMVGLPDEESILMYGYTVRRRDYRDTPVCTLRRLYLRPGEHANVAIRYGQCRPLQDVVWAGRGDQWVTHIVYGARSWAVAIKVVNVSDRDCWIERRTSVARIADYGNIPIVGQFVRPGLRRYMEWQQIIQENTLSAKARVRQEAYEQILRDAAPPAVMVPKYKWPTKLLESVTLNADIQNGGTVANLGSCGEVPDEMTQGSECDVFQSDLSKEDEDFELPSSAVPGTPLARLDAAYARCMRVSAEELDLEPAVYIREGSAPMFQLKDQLVMLPDLDDLSPECDIEGADVGEPGESTVAQEKQLKSILKRHKKILLGHWNASPPPARSVTCDLDVGDARPVAQRPRSVGPHLAIKVYDLLKKLLEATLIEHSESPWASQIVIVLKKNGVDIRMCIDYPVVNSFIQLSNYPLLPIDDLITGFEGMMWLMSLGMASGFWAVRMTARAKLISAFTCPFGHLQWVRLPFWLKMPYLFTNR
ncbi:hypothetical protein PHMEG_0002760 [Phytophthora megakarya]|uniref:Peptidase A2 domain-containing protein n=1 Tax=Phytophthora megakarya TaxID=4795 RepID=A0A225WXN1_9STRA|nr:hypothetical protein PHMEG_0002760 [Phytophthora megakarya]